MDKETSIIKAAKEAAKWWTRYLTGEVFPYDEEKIDFYTDAMEELFSVVEPEMLAMAKLECPDLKQGFRDYLRRGAISDYKKTLFEERLSIEIIEDMKKSKNNVSVLFTENDGAHSTLKYIAESCHIACGEESMFPKQTVMYITPGKVEVRCGERQRGLDCVYNEKTATHIGGTGK